MVPKLQKQQKLRVLRVVDEDNSEEIGLKKTLRYSFQRVFFVFLQFHLHKEILFFIFLDIVHVSSSLWIRKILSFAVKFQ